MTGLQLHQSNRMEALAAGLADLMRADPGTPIAPERIVVPHPTIGRWLSLELARELGIAANIRFELPAEFAWSVMRAADPELSRDQPFDPSRLRWRIHDLLAGTPNEAKRRAAGTDCGGGETRLPESGGVTAALQGAVGGYLRDGDRRKRLELADRLARMYDQCLLYRPDWIRAWESGGSPHWQGRLWQHLSETDDPGGAHHWVRAIERFRRVVREASGGSPEVDASARRSSEPFPDGPSSGPYSGPSVHETPGHSSSAAGRPAGPDWPRRATFFAVPALSPTYLEMLVEAARGMDVHLFLLNPCREYWGDIHSRREMDHRSGDADPGASYFTEGNELLAACGRTGRDMIDALVEAASAEWDDRFVVPLGERRLAAVQRDILDLRLAGEAVRDGSAPAVPNGGGEPAGETVHGPNRGAIPEPAPASLGQGEARVPPGRDDSGSPGAGSGGPSQVPPARDDSIEIHVCHSPVREAEVLHDRLLALFDAHRDLEPADVLVLTPDPDTYGPAIEAVFAAAGRIPCSVARPRATESRTMRAFLDLLSLARSRYDAEAVLAPLAAPAVRLRFGIGEADLPDLRGVVREAGIRWGVDEAHRVREGLPETGGHTWRRGLQRLVLGYAMADATVPVAGLVPCLPPGVQLHGAQFHGAEVDGALLGRFVSYCEEVFGLRERLEGELPPARWERVLQGLAERLLSDGTEAAGDWSLAGELAEETAGVRALVSAFGREAEHAEAPVPLEVVLDVLRERARAAGRGAVRLADGVTVTTLAMGGICPAEVVCLAGMNDGVFPRSPTAPSFDVLAAGPVRRGDRDVRYEDRYAFLEALLAARRCFVVTHAGRGLRDDAPIPPSVLVDELKDYLRRRFPGTELATLHPLQPFSPRYFTPRATHAPAGATGTTSGDPTGDSTGEPPCGPPCDLPGNPPGAAPGDERLVSYSRGMCEAATAMHAGMDGREFSNRFAGVALSEPDESLRRVDLAELTAFFANPTRFLLRDRLGVRLDLDDRMLETDEPFVLGGLERYQLRSEIWSQIQAGIEPERSAALLEGSGRLPQAALGRIACQQARSDVEPLGELLKPWRPALEATPCEVDFDIDGFRLTGTLRNVAGVPHADSKGTVSDASAADVAGRAVAAATSHRMIWWRIGALRARDRIEIWLRQLAWAAAGHGLLEVIVLRIRDGAWKQETFPPPEDAREKLGRWLRARWQGLATPLPFFPESSHAFANSIVRSGDAGGPALEKAREQARVAWFGGWRRRAEGLDAYFSLATEGTDPLTDAFEDLAIELLGPLAETQP